MRISNKCSMALHSLILLALVPEDKPTSEDIARSVGCNPVMIRSLLGKLKEAGIVTTRRGAGGSALAKKPNEITVWSVYQAVDWDSLDNLIGLHPHPYSGCPVGRRIYDLLEKPYERITNAMQDAMENTTLQELLDDYENMSKADKSRNGM